MGDYDPNNPGDWEADVGEDPCEQVERLLMERGAGVERGDEEDWEREEDDY